MRTKPDEIVPCPTCRRRIAFVVILEEGSVSREDKDTIMAYNLKHSESRTWVDKMLDSPFLFRRLVEEISRNGIAFKESL